MKKQLKKITLIFLASSIFLFSSFKDKKAEHHAAVLTTALITSAISVIVIATGGTLMFPKTAANVKEAIGNSAVKIWNQLNKTLTPTVSKDIANQLSNGFISKENMNILLNQYSTIVGNGAQNSFYNPETGTFTYSTLNGAFTVGLNKSGNTLLLSNSRFGTSEIASNHNSFIRAPYVSDSLMSNDMIFRTKQMIYRDNSQADVTKFVLTVGALSVSDLGIDINFPIVFDVDGNHRELGPGERVASVRVSNLGDTYEGGFSRPTFQLTRLDFANEVTTERTLLSKNYALPEPTNDYIDVPFLYRNKVGNKYVTGFMDPLSLTSLTAPISDSHAIINQPKMPTQQEIDENIRDMIITSGAFAGGIAIPQNPTIPSVDNGQGITRPGDLATNDEWNNAIGQGGNLDVDEVTAGAIVASLLIPFPKFPDVTSNFPDDWTIASILTGFFQSLGDILGWLGKTIQTGFINLVALLKAIPQTLIDILAYLKEKAIALGVTLQSILAKIGNTVAQPLDFIFTVPADVSLNFKPLEKLIPIDKFPFSIPWDYSALISGFKATPKAPRWELDIRDEKIIVDFEQFENLASLSRTVLSAVFIVGLMFATRQLMQGGN